MKKCLVIGYGSIGRCHTKILKKLNCEVSLVTAQQVNDFNTYTTIDAALGKNSIDYVIVANPTYLHYETLLQLIKCSYNGIVLVEKPLYSKLEELPKNNLARIFIGYNLRFSSMLSTLKKRIQDEVLISFSVNVGQYLPSWRKKIDYRHCYSAKKEQGGGVLHDLSHELDYSLWLCGKSLTLTSIGGHFSDLEIDSDDIYSILMQCEHCPIVTLQLNYLDRMKRRNILIHTQKHSIFVDLLEGFININGEIDVNYLNHLDESYIQQHQAILSGDYTHACDYQDALEIVKLIDKIDKANTEKKWISAC